MADLDHIFDLNHSLLPAAVRRLSARDVTALRRIAAGEEPGANRARAAEAYVLAKPAESVRLLAAILRGKDEDVGLRAQAATLLSGAPARPAEEALVAALSEGPDPLVASKISGALARIGGRSSLEALGAAAEGEDFAARRARFAQMVIAHRAGIAGHSPPLPPARELLSVPSRSLPVRASRAATEDVRALTATLGGDTYGIQLRNATTLAVRCGRERLLVVIDGRLATAELPKRVLARPVLVGVVAERAEVEPAYATRWVVLAGPLDEKHAYVALYRPDGALALSGTAEVAGASATFALRTSRRPGAVAVDVQGAVRAAGVSFSTSVAAERGSKPRVPASG